MFSEKNLQMGLEEMKIRVDERQMEKLKIFFETLMKWNSYSNLTRIIEPGEVITKHFLDSFAPVKLCPVKEGERICDIGTGAGFPGIPLKILFPGIHMDLIESQKKRVLFLKHMVQLLGLEDTRVIHGRAEELGKNLEYRETYDRVLARAVAPLNVLLELTLPFAVVGGVFIAYKGPKAYEEVKAAQNALDILGGEMEKIEMVKIPYGAEKRIIIIIKKNNETPPRYPRRPGIPGKNPL